MVVTEADGDDDVADNDGGDGDREENLVVGEITGGDDDAEKRVATNAAEEVGEVESDVEKIEREGEENEWEESEIALIFNTGDSTPGETEEEEEGEGVGVERCRGAVLLREK